MGLLLTAADAAKLPEGQHKDWAYNALDVTGTAEVFETLYPRLDPHTARTYAFERALQAPALAMMLRGVPVDILARNEAVKKLGAELRSKLKALQRDPIIVKHWDVYAKETGFCAKGEMGQHHKWPRGVADSPERRCERCGVSRMKLVDFNPGSSDHKPHLFYDLLGVPPMTNKQHKVSCDEDVLEKIAEKHKDWEPLITLILDCQGLAKQLGFLKAKLTPDQRFPSSFNVGAAWTGRFSSSKNPFGEGSNLQNISEQNRHIFIPDPGYEIFYGDLKQAESLTVAYLAGDELYIEAHKTGDTHTFVCRLLWPHLPWTGDLKKDKAIAKGLPPWDPVPGHDWRFQAKRIQHGSNYGLTPFGIAMIAHIPVAEAVKAQRNYFANFPFIRKWQNGIRAEVQSVSPLINPLGRKCRLFGRPMDEHTYKQGLAFKPQSAVADVLDLTMWRVWKQCDPHLIQLFAQVHDAILGQWPKQRREEAIETIVSLMAVDVKIGDRTMTIPVELAAGLNWGHKNTDPTKGPLNPYGIEEIEI